MVRKDRDNEARIINAIKRGGDSNMSEPRPIAKKLTLSDFDRGELDDALVWAGEANDQDVACVQVCCGFLEIFGAADGLAIGFDDEVARREARVGGGAQRV